MPTTYNPKYNTYIGARYVPLIDGEWDNTKQYEPLTDVLYQGSSYTSKTNVPKVEDINNDAYWVLSGQYNAQIGAIQEQVIQNTSDISTIKSDIEVINTDISDINDKLGTLQTSPYISVKNYGAVGDGVTDDTTAINAAVNAANNGDIVYFPTATYKVSSIVISKNITIDLCGSTILSDDIAFKASGTLKSTTTITSAYGQYSVPTFNVGSGNASVGDIAVFTSSTLYDTSRSYYLAGGASIVTGISGSQLSTSQPFPFGLESGATVKIYTPITVSIINGNIQSNKNLGEIQNGVIVSYGTNCNLSNLYVTGYNANIQYTYCVDSIISQCKTGSAKTSASQEWDGYGIMIATCTNVSVDHCTGKTGQHALSTGGWEVNFNISISNCSFSSEYSTYGYDNHANIYNSVITNCNLNGALIYGKVIIDNCIISGSAELSPSNDPERCEYILNNVSMKNSLYCYGRVTPSTDPNYKYFKGITLNGGQYNAILVNASFAGNSGEIGYIYLNSCTVVGISVYDKCNNLTATNINRNIDSAFISLAEEGSVGVLTLDNSTLGARYNLISGNNYGDVTFSNVTFTEGFSGARLLFTCQNLYITNSRMLYFNPFSPTVTGNFSAINSSFTATPLNVGASIYLSNVTQGSSLLNAITINSTKYKLSVSGSNLTVTPI